ncbi:MAG: rod shape-determining protein MreD [Clostridia bacterium]
MKRLKLFLWIFILFILKTVVINRINFFNSAPDLVFAFVIAYAMIEEDFYYAACTGIICGICTGSLCSVSFPVSVLMYTYSVLLVTALKNKPRYIPDFVKTLFWVFILSAAGEAVLYFTINLSMGINVLFKMIIPFGIYNLAAAALIYPLVKKTMHIVDDKKKLIPD